MPPGEPPRRAVGRRLWRGRVLLVLTAVGMAIAPLPATAIERWYSRGFFPALQAVVTPVTNLVPFALLDAVVVVALVIGMLRLRRSWRRDGAARAVLGTLVGLATVSAAVYLVFLVAWGLNYRRVPLERKLDYDPARVTRPAALELGRTAVQAVNDAYTGAHADAGDDRALAQALVEALRFVGGPPTTVPGVPKRSLLELYFQRAAIDGMTDPFFLEIILTPDALAVERPFVLAHEWAHLAGFADEAEANFVAWLTCARGGALARYSGWLAIYRHVAADLARRERHTLAAELAAGPRSDLAQIAARYARSSPTLREAARDTYDVYLRANRVEEGIESYDAVVRLILGVRDANGWVATPKPH